MYYHNWRDADEHQETVQAKLRGKVERLTIASTKVNELYWLQFGRLSPPEKQEYAQKLEDAFRELNTLLVQMSKDK